MYPHAVQFETRRLELEQWIQLNRDHRQARTRPRTIDAARSNQAPRASIAWPNATNLLRRVRRDHRDPAGARTAHWTQAEPRL